MSYLRLILILFLCSCGNTAYSQLADFTINVVVSDETCTNNGKLDMTVSGTTVNSTIVYRLYLSPDFVTSIAETSTSTFSSLAAGSYTVVATQTLNGAFNIATVDVVIDDETENLDFEISDSGAVDCGTTATVIVDVLSGNAVSYEIIAGPVLVPLQSSNEFTNLSSGNYLIRVFDDCGDALSKAYVLVIGTNNLNIGAPVLPNIYSSCTSVTIQNTVTTGSSAILYPLIVNYTVFAPDGSVSQNYSQTITSGGATVLQLQQVIDLFGGDLFTLSIDITDNCDNTVSKLFTINPNPKLSFAKFQDECGKPYFTVTISNYLPPFGLNFTQPEAFDPLLFNSVYPGPYNESTVPFGDEDNTVPFGSYSVAAIDSCGRTASLIFSFLEIPIEPSIVAANNGCDSSFGKVTIRMPNNGQIVSISIIEAPSAYPLPLPQNVFTLVNAQGVYHGINLPIGDYVFLIVDNCGNEYESEVNIPVFIFGSLVAEARPTCSPIFGAVKLATSNGALATVNITTAPVSYLQTLPQNVSYNINSDGNFYMSDLPTGMYTFATIDLCGYTEQISVQISGYNSNSDGFTLVRKCGAFDIILNDTDTSITGKAFWLQKFFPDTNAWGNPFSGATFIEGTLPTIVTAQQLTNPATLINIFLVGEFRIIKVFDTFGNGTPAGKCTDIYAEFEIAPELLISGVYNLNCIGGSGLNDVVIDVIGVEPIEYQITQPFFQDNGNNNVFPGLQQGIYNILATDDCGNIKNISIEIGTLLPLARAVKPNDLLECQDDGLQFGTFALIDQTPQVLGSQESTSHVVTYHLTQADADADVNPLPDGYTNISNPQTIYVRVEHRSIKLCYATTSFEIVVGATPILTPTSEFFICEGFIKKLTADNGFAAYEWSTGETTQSIIVNQPGTYTVTVKNIYNGFSCDASKDFIVTNSGRATIERIETSDWSANNNSVVINATGIGNYVYSLDNINFQTSNTFTNLITGFYTAYVKDIDGCGTVDEEFVLLNYPKYFTPNGDGYNETWQIQFSRFEPSLNADIFDRFGKFIIRLKGGESGWDGTYNGQAAISTDYWFVVTREDGKIYRGHFSLKR